MQFLVAFDHAVFMIKIYVIFELTFRDIYSEYLLNLATPLYLLLWNSFEFSMNI